HHCWVSWRNRRGLSANSRRRRSFTVFHGLYVSIFTARRNARGRNGRSNPEGSSARTLCTFGSVARSNRGGRISKTDRYQSDRKSTRLNSSHVSISYAVFCLTKKIYIYEI